jgi:hypothetical protein
MRAAATSEVAKGRKYIAAQRLRHLRLMMRLRPSATASARMTVTGTENRRSLTVFRTAFQKPGIGEHLFIEAQPDVLLRSTRSDLVERIHDGLRERQQEHRAEEQSAGEDEEKSPPRFWRSA